MSTLRKEHSQYEHLRKGDPYMDRRSGEDRRQVYSLDYFLQGNPDRRKRRERRIHKERRLDHVQISKWYSVCPDKNELSADGIYKINMRKLRK